MGRLALIIVIGFGVLLAIMSRAITGRLSDAVDISTTYYNETRAKNIASSAAEIYLRKVKESEAGPGTYSINSVMGGNASIIITDYVDLVDSAKPDSLLMTSIGRYQNIKDTTVILLAGNLSPGVEINGGIAISSGSQALLKSSGKDTTDGRNYNLAGTALDNSCADVNAITYGDPPPTINHSGTWSITGSGATPDTQYVADQPNYDALAIQLAAIADTTITWTVSGGGVHQYGTVASPMITVFKSPGNASGTIAGAGILIMDLRTSTANMNFSGTLTWTGLCIVIGDPKCLYEAKWSNALPITGALLLTGTCPKFETSNNLKIHYSCDAIDLALSTASLPGNYVVLDWWE